MLTIEKVIQTVRSWLKINMEPFLSAVSFHWYRSYCTMYYTITESKIFFFRTPVALWSMNSRQVILCVYSLGLVNRTLISQILQLQFIYSYLPILTLTIKKKLSSMKIFKVSFFNLLVYLTSLQVILQTLDLQHPDVGLGTDSILCESPAYVLFYSHSI